jgi:glycosyltransferase involved in cell wall biosynthesis
MVLIREAITCFLWQDYPSRELIILNDCKEHEFRFEHPQVRIINHPNRYLTLGAKRNALARVANGDIFVPWDDDDISLPRRLSQAVEALKDFDYFNPKQSWYEESGVLRHDHQHQVCHNASAIRKDCFWSIGGYPLENGSEDASINNKLNAATGIRVHPGLKDKSEWTYVYRGGVSDQHISGFPDMDKAYLQFQNKPRHQCVAYLQLEMRKNYPVLIDSILTQDKKTCGLQCEPGKCKGKCRVKEAG